MSLLVSPQFSTYGATMADAALESVVYSACCFYLRGYSHRQIIVHMSPDAGDD